MSVVAPKVAVISGAYDVAVVEMFHKHGWDIAKDLASADMICWTGGADLNPKMYGEKPIAGVGFNDARDAAEKWIYNAFPSKRRVGICRGGQLLNVLNGGKLWQDVDNHHSPHMIRTDGGKMHIQTTSVHHQMMIPNFDTDPKPIVFAEADKARQLTNSHKTITRKPGNWVDVEGVFYPKTKSLCYQPHPENDKYVGQEFFFKAIQKYLDISAPMGLRVPPFDAEDITVDDEADPVG